MKQHDDRLRLCHMLDYARLARRLAHGKTRDDLNHDDLLRLGLTRAIEVIGEAAARVSPAFCTASPSIPWQQIVGTRHRLIHGYDAVDLDLLWAIINNDLPPLIADLEQIVGGGDGSDDS